MKFLPYGRQSIDEDDVAAVLAILRSDFLTCGPQVEAFEREFAGMVGAKHAVAVCNATAALHLAVALGPHIVTMLDLDGHLLVEDSALISGGLSQTGDILEVDTRLSGLGISLLV